MKRPKKKIEEMTTREVEMNPRMAERVKWIDKQTYWYLIQLLELDVDEAKKKITVEC